MPLTTLSLPYQLAFHPGRHISFSPFSATTVSNLCAPSRKHPRSYIRYRKQISPRYSNISNNSSSPSPSSSSDSDHHAPAPDATGIQHCANEVSNETDIGDASTAAVARPAPRQQHPFPLATRTADAVKATETGTTTASGDATAAALEATAATAATEATAATAATVAAAAAVLKTSVNADIEESPMTSESGECPPRRHPLTVLFLCAVSLVRHLFVPTGFVCGVAAGMLVTIALVFVPNPLASRDAMLREKVTLFNFILHDINTSYVDAIDVNRLFETGVNAMLGTLDPYTHFETNGQALEMAVKTNGRYAGVGLGISLGEPPSAAAPCPIVVVSAFEGYAFDAGMRPGDIIESVAGQAVSGASLEKVTDMLRGEPGTVVEVTVSRQGAPQPLSFQLARCSVHIKDVPAAALVGDLCDRIAYIRLQSFAKGAASEVGTALVRLNKATGGLKGVVLDLRGNPGGLLDAAVEVAEMFLPKGSTIVSTKGRGLVPSPEYVSSKDPMRSLDVPVAVLVNEQTASASEIVAGALQDLDYGVIVGSKTFGKGLVQNVQELPFNTALKYTVGKYYTPSGRCIQALTYEQAEDNGPFETKRVNEKDRHVFLTRNGRPVRDGGGIEPDVEVMKRVSFLETALQRQNMYFKFATKCCEQWKFEKLPDGFEITDGIYQEFIKFVSSSQFRYESRFDKALKHLDEMFKEVGYNSARGKISDLKKVTRAELRSDFVRHEKDIRIQLESAIRYRFQPDSERIIAGLRYDTHLAEALRVLKVKDDYEQLLNPSLPATKAVSSVTFGYIGKG